MDDEEILSRLPVAYATALRLRAAGAEDGLIARAVAVEPGELPLLMQLAEAKLRRARVHADTDGSGRVRRPRENEEHR